MPVYAAFLRAVNVGGRNGVPMAALRERITALGHRDVVTYVQSGNVVFGAASPRARDIAAEIERCIADGFGVDTAVVVRTLPEMTAIAAGHPFAAAAATNSQLHVLFLADRPSTDALASLDHDRSPPDVFVVRGGEIFAYFPNGAGTTKLSTGYFEKRLETVVTARNWNTVERVLDLMKATPPGGR